MKFFVTFTLIVLYMAIIAIFPDGSIIKGIIGFGSFLAWIIALQDIDRHKKE